jgi:hypothetical protein
MLRWASGSPPKAKTSPAAVFRHGMSPRLPVTQAGTFRLLPSPIFRLDRANDAVTHAAANAGPFKMTVLRPT